MQEVSVSNLDPKAGYSESCSEGTANRGRMGLILQSRPRALHSSAFHLLYDSLFIKHPVVTHHITIAAIQKVQLN